MYHDSTTGYSHLRRLCLLLAIACPLETLFCQNNYKRYPASESDKYWFQLQNDLYFSEELPLPGYNEEELGKLEYPTIAVDSRQNVYIAYNYTSPDGHEAVYLNNFNDADIQYDVVEDANSRRYLKLIKRPTWKEPIQVSTVFGVEYRPRIAVTNDDVVWIVWSGKRKGEWNIFARQFSDGQLGKEIQLTSQTGYNFRPVILADASDRVWVAWERGTPDKQMHIVAKYYKDGHWSDEIIVESRSGYAYRPTLLEGPDGTLWFAWDLTQNYNTDVYVRRFKDGKFDQPIRVTYHLAIDCKPALAWYNDKLWVAWTTNRRGNSGWGIIRYPMVRAFDRRNWYEPVANMGDIDLFSRSETQNYEYPTLTFDPYGRLYIFNRHDHVFSAAYYENGEWSENWLLDELGWGQRGFYVHVAWVSDDQLWMARRDRRTIFIQKMIRLNPKKLKVLLKRYVRVPYPEKLDGLAEDSYRGPTKHGNYKIYYGEIHVHTAYSDGSGSFDELFNLYKNIYRLDFLAITEHDALSAGYNHLSPGEWAYLKSLNELYNQPGKFVTINAYEWTHSTWSGRQDSTVRIGHKNVYFKGGEESPFFSHFDKKTHDAASLFKTLHDHNTLAWTHHPPWGGITWEDHDPAIETNYEIVSIHGANEYMGNLPITHRGGMPESFAQDGLAKGLIFGFVGGSDSHGLYYHCHEGWQEDPYKGGLTGVLLDGPLTRENVWEALQSRRNYATSGEKYYLEFTINGYPMGSYITTNEPPVISFEAKSYNILYAYIIRNNEELLVTGNIGGGWFRYRGIKDETIQPSTNFYYLRVVYKDGTLAWSSPIWVDYKPR